MLATGAVFGDSWTWDYTYVNGSAFFLNLAAGIEVMGDVNGTGKGTKLFINDNQGRMILGDVASLYTGTTLDIRTLIPSLSFISASNQYLVASPSSGFYGLGDIDFFNNGTSIQMDDSLGTILLRGLTTEMNGGIILSGIQTPAYGSTYDLSLGATNISDIEFTTGTGASSVLLPTGTIAPLGTVLIIKDLDAIAAANNITVNAGTGNTINGATIGQTYPIATNGECITIKKVTATAWAIQ